MAQTFAAAAAAGLTGVAVSLEGSTICASEAHRQHFLKCLRMWDAMLPRKSGDELAGELLAAGYYRMLGRLSQIEMSQLTELVLNRCRWFPTVAECNELMAENSYSNPFFSRRRHTELDRLGYTRTVEPGLLADGRPQHRRPAPSGGEDDRDNQVFIDATE